VSAFDYTPTAFLYGYVDTDHPGYRQVRFSATTYTVAAGHYRWDAYLAAINTAISGAGWAVAATSTGQHVFAKASGSSSVQWTDRLGWLLGFDSEPGVSEYPATSYYSRRPAPGAIPLIGATWDHVSVAKERQLVVDRSQRGHGYVFGSARVWRWRLTMDYTALHALQSGWCLGGTVLVSAKAPASLGADSAWSTSNTGGYVEGQPIGIESIEWIDDLQQVAVVSLLMTTQGA
tara:strand:- start:466 stop:1164 length:699 start_codon:yes stop_codon:yes gene_type:complete